ncbi:MAG TPA: hypothetical protein VFO67_03535 [Gemmatimonadales bacterium]|nr:hypothetical protein [Gemmatimonadales bacterium]
MRTTSLVVLFGCLCAAPTFAQDEKGWVDVNFGVAGAAEDSFSTTASGPLFFETATFGAIYDVPRGASFDFGGGYMLTPIVGIGVSFQGTAHEGYPGLSIRIPHPLFFNAHATDARLGDTALERTEGSVHIQAMIVATPNSNRVRVRFFGGPTYFRVTQETVDTILYDQVFQFFGRLNVVEITNYEFSKSEGTGWGFHVGGDVGVFFTRIFGIGGFVKFSRGNVELSDFSGAFEVDAGGFQTGGGVRLKF